MNTGRTREWFDDDDFWRELYGFMFSEQRFADAEVQVEKALKLVRFRGKAVLDLACGPGRWAIPLAQRGFAVTGVDRSKALLTRAAARARAAGLDIEWIRQDMRDFLRPDSFDLAVNVFTSFGYFDDPAQDVEVLRNLYASLRPAGICLLEMMGKEILARLHQPTTSDVLPDGALLVQRHGIFDGWSRVRNEWTLVRRKRVRTFQFHHTIYSGQELRDRLEQVGFKDIRLYGSLDGEDYGVAAVRLVVVARKPPLARRASRR